MLSTQYDWYMCEVAHTGFRPATVKIEGERFVIGRRAGVDLKLSSQFVSGQHAQVDVRGDRCFITDLGSRNGVFVNGERIRRGQLGVGDLLTIGDVEFRMRRQHRSGGDLGHDSGVVDLAEEQLRWLSEQLDRLFGGDSVSSVLTPANTFSMSTLLTPVHSVHEDGIVGYRATACSDLSGLESESKIIRVAQQLGREPEVNSALVSWNGSAAQRIGKGRWLCLNAPPAINSEQELLPALEALRADYPETQFVLAFSDLPERNLRSLRRLAAALADLKVRLEVADVQWKHLEFLQASGLKPDIVRVHRSLLLESIPTGELQRIRSLADRLHHRGTRLAAENVNTEEQLAVYRESGVDLVEGPYFEEPLPLPSEPLPDTNILTSSQVAALQPAQGNRRMSRTESGFVADTSR